jgi:hypothetical protein
MPWRQPGDWAINISNRFHRAHPRRSLPLDGHGGPGRSVASVTASMASGWATSIDTCGSRASRPREKHCKHCNHGCHGGTGAPSTGMASMAATAVMAVTAVTAPGPYGGAC